MASRRPAELNISEGNGRRRQLFCLHGHFALRSKPFWRPSDLTHFVHCFVGKLWSQRRPPVKYRHIPVTCRLTLSKMASNLDGDIYEFTA
jgi:hypothetical protein